MMSDLIKLVLVCICVPVTGLVSCSPDEFSKDKPVDTWEGAPTVALKYNDNQAVITRVSPDIVITEDDRLVIVPPSSVTAVDALSDCWADNGLHYVRDEAIAYKNEHKIVDIVPTETLPIDRDTTFTCHLGLRIHNEHGSTRRRLIGPLKVRLHNKLATFKLNSDRSFFSIAQLQNVYLEGYEGTGHLHVSCSSGLSKGDFTKVNEKSVGSVLSPSLKMSSYQKCRAFIRTAENSTVFGPMFEFQAPTPGQDVIYTTFVNQSHDFTLNNELVLSIQITNWSEQPQQYRYRKDMGSIVLRYLNRESDHVIVSNYHQRPLKTQHILPANVSLFEDETYEYITLPPNATINIDAYSMFAIKCGTPSGVIGFDFEFYPMTGVIVERARYPIRKGSESDFQAAHRSNVEFANVHEVSGGNRWRWFVKWAHSSQPDVLVQGDLPQELRCEN